MITNFRIFENKWTAFVRCNWCDKYFFDEQEEIKYNNEGDEICPFCGKPGMLMDIYLDEFNPEFSKYIKNNQPKTGIDPKNYKNPLDFYKAAYPEFFTYKKYNL